MTLPGTRTAVAEPRDQDRLRWVALAAVAMVQLMIAVDATAMNVAVPSIRAELGASPGQSAWIVHAYLLAAAGLLLLGGKVGDLTGRKRAFWIGAATFGTASVAAALAPNPGLLITARFVQGAGEALATSAGLAILVLLFPSGRSRAQALGVWAAIGASGAGVGLLLSGLLVDAGTWRLIFWINVPVTIAALLLVWRIVPGDRPARRAGGLDVLGAVLITFGVVALVAAVQRGFDVPGLGLLAASVLALSLFGLRQARAAVPLIPPAFFRNPLRLWGIALTVLVTATLAGMFFAVTFYVQSVREYSAFAAGLAFLPFCLAALLAMLLVTPIITRYGVRAAVGIGCLITAIGTGLLAVVPPSGPYWTGLFPALVVLAVGITIGLPALQTATLHGLTAQDAGLGSGVQATMQQFGGAIGIAAMTALAQPGSWSEWHGGAPGYQGAFLANTVVIAVVGLLAALLMPAQPPTSVSSETKP